MSELQCGGTCDAYVGDVSKTHYRCGMRCNGGVMRHDPHSKDHRCVNHLDTKLDYLAGMHKFGYQKGPR